MKKLATLILGTILGTQILMAEKYLDYWPFDDRNPLPLKAEVLVIDSETGHPCPNASVIMRYAPFSATGESASLEKETNDKGKVYFDLNVIKVAYFTVKKEGYYNSKLDAEIVTQKELNEMMDSLNKKVTLDYVIELRPIKNPMTMHTPWVTSGIGDLLWNEERYGYDMVEGAWVSPWGIGKRADIYFQIKGLPNVGSRKTDKLELIIEFPNPHDGLIAVKKMTS